MGAGLVGVADEIAHVENGTAAVALWIVSYAAIGIGAAGTSFLARLATAADDARKGAAAIIAWLMLIFGAIVAFIGTGITLEHYSGDRLIAVIPVVTLLALLLAAIATWGMEEKLGVIPAPSEPNLGGARRATWADPAARTFMGFVFLSILAFYLSELVLEPFAGHVHGLPPEDSTKLSDAKDGAALLGMLAAGTLSTFRIGSLRAWAVIGCIISVAGLIATGIFDIARLTLPVEAAYATVFGLEAILFVAAAVVAGRLLPTRAYQPALQPGE